jgi:hypothetical protein
MKYSHYSGLSHGSDKIQTFTSETDRERLKITAIISVKKLALEWGLTRDETAMLLALSPSTWDRILSHPEKASLNQDQMMRISALIGIFKGLQLLFTDNMANRWPRLKNAGPIFNDHTPIDIMLDGGIPVMLEVRNHVDALRGGL